MRAGLVRDRCREADFVVDDHGVEHAIDLKPDIDAGRIRLVAITATELVAFRDKFDPLYVQRLDDGETESLAFCLREGDPYRLCSSDAIVFKVLAVVDRSDQGVSLEEVLQSVGLTRRLSQQFTKAFRDENRARGLQDRLSGIGLKP